MKVPYTDPHIRYVYVFMAALMLIFGSATRQRGPLANKKFSIFGGQVKVLYLSLTPKNRYVYMYVYVYIYVYVCVCGMCM